MLLLLLMSLRRGARPSFFIITILLLSEILLVNGVIAVNGAATNPFSAVLLIPTVLAFMLLPFTYAVLLLLVSVTAQASQLLLMSEHAHHQSANMLDHSQAMIQGFVITSVLIAVIVVYFRRQIAKRERDLQQHRERQLRDEQLLAIGTAAAQFTHDVATPAQSIKWLLEEANEDPNPPVWLPALNAQFQRIQNHLQDWRLIADDIRAQRVQDYDVASIWKQLQQSLMVARPEALVQWQNKTQQNAASLAADRTLLPAIVSVIINSCEAAEYTDDGAVAVESDIVLGVWTLSILNRIDDQDKSVLEQLGQQFVRSEKGIESDAGFGDLRGGFGVGAVISNATIEKFGGHVRWEKAQNDNKQKCILTTIEIPVNLS